MDRVKPLDADKLSDQHADNVLGINSFTRRQLGESEKQVGVIPLYDELAIEGELEGEKKMDPAQSRPDGLSLVRTLANFLKAMVGTGVFSLPIAFKRAGLWMGLILVLAFGLITNFCMHQIVFSSRHLAKKRRVNSAPLSYGSAVSECCATSFGWLRPCRNILRFIVNTSVVSLQLGISSVYYVFMCSQLKEVFDEKTSWDISMSTWLWLLLPPLILINFTRSLQTIAVFSMIGNILVSVCFLFVFQYLLLRAEHTFNLPWITDLDGIMTACGAILYSFEGQVIPLETKLRKPNDMIGLGGVLSLGVGIATVLYASMGFVGYVTYGSAVKGSVTLNLPTGLPFTIMKLVIVAMLFFGFPIQQYVIIDMLWPALRDWCSNRCLMTSKLLLFGAELVFRAALVVICMAFAMSIPHLEHIIPLVGVTSGMLLAFIFPPLMDTATFLPEMLEKRKHDSSMTWKIPLRILQNSLLACLGLFGLVAGLRSSIKTILEAI